MNNFIKVTIAHESLKTKHDVLKEEKINQLEKIQFLENEYKSLQERNSALTLKIEHQRKDVPSKNEIFHLGTK